MFVCRKNASVRPYAVKILFFPKICTFEFVLQRSGSFSRNGSFSFFLFVFFFCQKKIRDTNIQYITKLNRSVIQGLKRRKL